VSESKVEFVEANVLRLIAVLSLCIANVYLILENWAMFFFVLILGIFFEILQRKLYEVLLHNYAVAQYKQKFKENETNQQDLNAMQS
jgi:uncharacterized membrane protein YbaN (DUF454 family)